MGQLNQFIIIWSSCNTNHVHWNGMYSRTFSGSKQLHTLILTYKLSRYDIFQMKNMHCAIKWK